MFSESGNEALSRLKRVETRSISPENPDGSMGGGARAVTGSGSYHARELGVGWKISPRYEIQAGQTQELANIREPGIIQHVWMTIPQDAWRACILRAYWDDDKEPAIEVPYGDFFCNGWIS